MIRKTLSTDLKTRVASEEATQGLQKGGDPAAGSPTATLLRLHPNHQPYLGRLPPLRVGSSDFWYNGLSWCDGRCVQGPGTYSPRRADPGLLAIPPSWGRVADPNLN